MRVSAVGWFFDTLEETERVAAISAAITHNHLEGIKGAQATASAIYLARTGKTKVEIKDYIETTYGYDLHKSWEYWHPLYEWEDSCQGTVPQAIISFLDSTDFEDAIRKAVSLGGDSDTLACITGGIAEAYYKEIPEAMAARVLDTLPEDFKKTLEEFRHNTEYGKQCRII
jgi:ADP-ribosylglycohydrolase